MPVQTAENYIVVSVDEVDLTNRLVHCKDKTNSNIICSFRATGAGVFYVPNQGELWLAKRIGNIWHLEALLDTADQQAWAEANLQPGDLRIEADNIFLEGTVHGIVQGGGTPGLDGLDGSTGAAGSTGPEGLPGIDGLIGPQGGQGVPGIDGLDGSTGPQGGQGIPGLDGIDGKLGPQGLDGLEGNLGPMGSPGMDGLQGPQGVAGFDGTPGLDGSFVPPKSQIALIVALGS